MAFKLLLIIYYASALTNIESARILAVFPFPSISHQVVFRKLTQELAKRGHDITVLTPDPAFPNGGAPSNFNEIDLHDISYQTWQKLFQEDFRVRKNFISFSEIRRMTEIMGILFKTQLQSPKVQEILTNTTNKFDLVLMEAIMRPALVFSHIYNAPIILVSSLGAMFNNHHIMGSPTHPLLYPSPLHQRIYNLTVWEKLEELYNHFSTDYALYLNEADETHLIRQMFGPEIPPLSDLYNNVDMLFINIHPLWANNQPVPPNVIYMGGIHQLPEKELPNDLKKYLESSTHGVIYLSFGTNVLSGMMPPDKIQIIIKVLSHLPYDVLWKWDKDELPGKSNNIKISKWFPQSDLLRHPKVKLFITQAGLQSTDEAITAGVPLIAIPMLGDQWYNAEKYVKYGIGKHLNIENLTEDILKDAVETVIKDESYRKNIVRLRQLMRDQPESPLKRAVWWTEYVIRHGGAKELRAASANISYAQYFEVELILVLLALASIVLVAFLLAIVVIAELNSAKILAVFPVPSISHQVVFRPITQELVKRGHEVTVITPDPAFPKGEAPLNLTEIDVHDISYTTWRNSYMDSYKADGSSTNYNVVRQKWPLLSKIVEMQLQSSEVQKIINDKNNKFDLILIEAMIRPALVFSYIFKAPIILVSSLGAILSNQKVMGLHAHPLLYPSALQKRIYNLTLTEKLNELYKYCSIELADYLNEVDENKLLRKMFGPRVPPLSELYLRVDMLFINISPIWVDNQPVPPTVQYIGGIHRKSEKELPKDLQTYLNSSKHGVIYLSFGTNALARTIPQDKIRVIVNVLSELSYDVLWKWDEHKLPGQSDNIKLSKWYPQYDLLRHPKVKLFITQAGLQSTDEAINAGVPLVAIPMLGDQWYNAEKCVKHGIGKKLDINTLTETGFRNAVENVIKDDSYKKNIIKLRTILEDQPDTALQRAVWWAEYVIRHSGAKHLRPPSANVSFTEYFEIEVLFIMLLVVLTVLATISISIIFVTLKILNRFSKQETKLKGS
ncbi:UDP-glycosyltransferase UGT5-like [Pararge aegeria]|uniref:UDP-glycosyltransferase UGT5-like n=1 Tax=Pararge aegeria TaxID=116150 RepID=UPI0019D08A13|nr:UDP-glycosyltransferase UGT5-like [Pararge aegeria]